MDPDALTREMHSDGAVSRAVRISVNPAEDVGESLSRGYRHTGTPGSAHGARPLADEYPPVIVLMDTKLKGDMDGIGAAQAIRECYQTPADTAGRITFMNPAAEIMAGRTALETLGTSIDTLLRLPGDSAAPIRDETEKITGVNGAQIRAESGPGEGIMFRMYFPRQTAPHDPVQNEPAIQRSNPALKTVLVVEDQPYLLAMVNQIVSDSGYNVLEASNMEQALVVAEMHAGKIDLLLSDISMPGGSGPELARKLFARHRDLKVMFMSGYGENVLGQDALSGPFEFIQKPFDPEVLTQRIAAILNS